MWQTSYEPIVSVQSAPQSTIGPPSYSAPVTVDPATVPAAAIGSFTTVSCEAEAALGAASAQAAASRIEVRFMARLSQTGARAVQAATRAASPAITLESCPPCHASGDAPGSSETSSAPGIASA